jgi:hypothetical protein
MTGRETEGIEGDEEGEEMEFIGIAEVRPGGVPVEAVTGT